MTSVLLFTYGKGRAAVRLNNLPTLTLCLRGRTGIWTQDCLIARLFPSQDAKFAEKVHGGYIWKGEFYLICGGVRDLGLLGNGTNENFGKCQ